VTPHHPLLVSRSLPRTATPVAFALALLCGVGWPGLVRADGEEQSDSTAATETPDDDPTGREPNPCGTCGTGMISLALVLTSPLSVIGAASLFGAMQAGWIEADPANTLGIPLWGYGVGCAAAHLFFAAVTSVAFWRDLFMLCGSLGSEITEELEAEIEEEIEEEIEAEADPVPVSAGLAGPTPIMAY